MLLENCLHVYCRFKNEEQWARSLAFVNVHQQSLRHIAGALNFPTLLWVLKALPGEYLGRKGKIFVTSLVSTPLCVTKTHLFARKDLGHLTEDQWGLVTLLHGGKGAVFCGRLNVTVVIVSHHFLLILEIPSEICGSLRPAAGGSS